MMKLFVREPGSQDRRLQFIILLLPVAFVGHCLQLAGEDTPWAPHAWPRYYWTPGWHLFVPPSLVIAIAVLLALAMLGVAIFRNRIWVSVAIVLYAAHYFTYPYRIRNHMTYMLTCLTAIGGAWLIGALTKGASRRTVDRFAVGGVAMCVCLAYFFAALHKTNTGFLTFAETSPAVSGVHDFWRYGDLGHAAPMWIQAVAIYGTLLIEYTAPITARLFTRTRVWVILALMAFHFPHVAVMNVADYPMLASTFWPALFTAAHFRLLSRYLFRFTWWNLVGALIGSALQVWWIPWWGELTIFGIAVMAIWGWWAASMLQMQFRSDWATSKSAKASALRLSKER